MSAKLSKAVYLDSSTTICSSVEALDVDNEVDADAGDVDSAADDSAADDDDGDGCFDDCLLEDVFFAEIILPGFALFFLFNSP